MASRFVRPESRKLDLSNGDWLLVRARLSAGEQRAAFIRAYVQGADGSFVVHPGRVSFEKISAYLLDWSFVDDQDQQVVIRNQPIDVVQSALNALDPADYAEVRAAVDAHEAAMMAARDAQKKTPAGVTASLPTSASPDASTGASPPSAPSTSTSAPS